MSRIHRLALPLLAIAASAAMAVALLVGSGPAGPATVGDLLRGTADPVDLQVLVELRLVRSLAAFGTGAALAVAGVLMQVLLRNPLADPYILGSSGGAAVAALLLLSAGAGGALVDLGAFAGALSVTVGVFALNARSGLRDTTQLLLTGVVVAAACGAMTSLILALSPDASLRGILFWLMGDFGLVEDARPVLLVALAGSGVAFVAGRSLDVLGTGGQQAALLGLDAGRWRNLVYGLAALLTAISVTTAGVVGFVGLVVPHGVRLMVGSAHRRVVPAAALAGGTLLVLADTLARTLLAPRQLPVGAITAAVGVPLFLLLLRRTVRRPA